MYEFVLTLQGDTLEFLLSIFTQKIAKRGLSVVTVFLAKKKFLGTGSSVFRRAETTRTSRKIYITTSEN